MLFELVNGIYSTNLRDSTNSLVILYSVLQLQSEFLQWMSSRVKETNFLLISHYIGSDPLEVRSKNGMFAAL